MRDWCQTIPPTLCRCRKNQNTLLIANTLHSMVSGSISWHVLVPSWVFYARTFIAQRERERERQRQRQRDSLVPWTSCGDWDHFCSPLHRRCRPVCFHWSPLLLSRGSEPASTQGRVVVRVTETRTSGDLTSNPCGNATETHWGRWDGWNPSFRISLTWKALPWPPRRSFQLDDTQRNTASV